MNPKQHAKRNTVVRVIAFLLIVALVYGALTRLLTVNNATEQQYIRSFYLEPKNSLDVMILGASETFTDYCAPLAWQHAGFTSYPLAVSAAQGTLYASMLRESAKRQNPSVYVVEVNGFLYTEDERKELGKAATREWLDTLPLSRNKVQAINENGTDSSGNAAAYITLVQDGAYRVKGKINELNRSDIAVGVPVVIRSRVDDSVWSGTITEIDTENPSSGNADFSYGYGYSNSDDTSSSSNYPFYVELDSTDGLMLGQHVYIEPSDGGTVSDTMKLDASFLQGSAEEGFWVWAEKDGKLEKRTVTVGTFDETYNTYEILDGLAAEDYIAFPEDGMEEGDPTTHTMPTEDPNAEPSDGVDDSGMIDNGGIDDGYVDSGAIGDSADTGLIEGGEEESAGSEDGESSQTGGVTYAR